MKAMKISKINKITLKKKAFYRDLESIREIEEEKQVERIIEYFKKLSVPKPFKIKYMETEDEQPEIYTVKTGMGIYNFLNDKFGLWAFLDEAPSKAINEKDYSLNLWLETIKEYNEEPPYITFE